MISLTHFLVVSLIIFCIGLYGALTKSNAIQILMSIELMMNAANINLVAFSKFISGGMYTGQVFAVFIMVIAAAELGVGLAIILSMYKNREVVDVDKVNLFKG